MFLEGLWLSAFVISVFKQQLRIRACATCSCLTFNQTSLGLLIFLLETAACIQRCRIAGAQLLPSGHLGLATWPDVLDTLEGAHVDGCGYGNLHQLWKRHLQATAETPFT